MISYDELENAFYYVSTGEQYELIVLLNTKTGKIYFDPDYSGEEEEYPSEDEIESGDYVEIPHKNDLDLGVQLVYDFVSEYIPEEYETVRSIFSSRGAYGRYKDLLRSLNMLEKWYEYEDKKTKAALIEWCKENNIDVELPNKD